MTALDIICLARTLVGPTFPGGRRSAGLRRSNARLFERSAQGAVLLCAAAFSPVSLAAETWGYGAIYSNGVASAIDYQDPTYLNVAKEVQLNPLGIPGSKVLAYYGEAQFGRIGVGSHIGGTAPANPDLDSSVSIAMAFQDLITPRNLSLVTPSYLRLDISLSGEMLGAGATNNGLTIGKLTAATFDIVLSDTDPATQYGFNILASIQFSWFGDNFFITNESGSFATPRFMPFAGEEPRFTQNLIPGLPAYSFATRGYLDIPLDGSLPGFDGKPVLASGAPFLLEFAAKADSSCGNEIPACTAITDFGHTALIGNARIVDAFGNLAAGGFTSESGYDYITPPGGTLAPIPEPQSWALLLAGITLIGAWRNRVAQTR